MGKRWLALAWVCLLTLLGGIHSREEATQASAWEEGLPEQNRYVALTFDDGPQPETTARLLDGLRQRGASATFFLVGERAAAYPELVRRMKAEGHQVGSHTWSHVRLQGASAQTLLDETGRAQRVLTQILGEGSYWLRPPYGLLDEQERALVEVPLIKWSVDPRDWESRDTAKVVEAVMGAVKENSIVLLHDIYPTSVEACHTAGDFLFAYCSTSRMKVRIRKTAPTHLVARASLASMVLALFLARKESATPPMEPDRPALLPDWNRTTRMIARPHSSCRIVITRVKASIGKPPTCSCRRHESSFHRT